MVVPTILALDFDGVLCDGLIEYFQTAWRTYCQIWTPADATPPEGLAAVFYRLRPVVETGWEMPVLLRALLLGVPEAQILQDWPAIAQELLKRESLSASGVGKQLDGIRDQWMAENLPEWLSLHRFYPGTMERLRALIESPVKPMIITTKEGRFTRALLQQQGVEMPAGSIFGKESQRPKHQVLRELLQEAGDLCRIWFVEDRLKTLLSVRQQPDLSEVQLYLADWGYNTVAERDSVAQNRPIQLLSLSQFAANFAEWPGSDL